MKSIFISILSLSLLCAASCKSKQTQASPKSEALTLIGTFESRRGVMDPLSCFCYNCGYLTTAKGEKIAVCITDEGVTLDCKNVVCKGKYVTVKKDKETNGVCAGGTMTYFEASSVKCN